MSNRGIAVLALRLFALFLMFHSLTALPQVYLARQAVEQVGGDQALLALMALAHLGPAALGVLIWLLVGRFAEWILPRRRLAGEREPPLPEDWQALAFAAGGMFVVIDGLPALIGLAVGLYQTRQPFEALSSASRLELAVAAGRVLLGLLVLLGSRGLGRLVFQLRRGGVVRT